MIFVTFTGFKTDRFFCLIKTSLCAKIYDRTDVVTRQIEIVTSIQIQLSRTKIRLRKVIKSEKKLNIHTFVLVWGVCPKAVSKRWVDFLVLEIYHFWLFKFKPFKSYFFHYLNWPLAIFPVPWHVGHVDTCELVMDLLGFGINVSVSSFTMSVI